ncbi:MAG: restriction endonuclease [Kofleriaceae bacterium]|nr:restriction endonuclease [Kofleriaceae bacterium]
MDELSSQIATEPTSISKFAIVRKVLTVLNDEGDSGIRPRREIIKRVCEFEDFSRCWENDRLEAEGLVARLRQVVGIKDSFTRMKHERDRELDRHRQDYNARMAKKRLQQERLLEIKKNLSLLVTDPNPWRRGKALEGVLNRFFSAAGILVREAFIVKGNEKEGIVEQIDGLIESDGHLVLVEMKWHREPIGQAEISPFLVKVYSRGDARGIFISASGYTDAAIATSRVALHQKAVALAELEELFFLLDGDGDLETLLRAKMTAAIVDRNPLFRPPRT